MSVYMVRMRMMGFRHEKVPSVIQSSEGFALYITMDRYGDRIYTHGV